MSLKLVAMALILTQLLAVSAEFHEKGANGKLGGRELNSKGSSYSSRRRRTSSRHRKSNTSGTAAVIISVVFAVCCVCPCMCKCMCKLRKRIVEARQYNDADADARRLTQKKETTPPGRQINVNIEKTADISDLGIVGHVTEDEVSWMVDEVNDGLMKLWNEQFPDLAVVPGDFIVACNGARGDGHLIRWEASNSETLKMTVVKKVDVSEGKQEDSNSLENNEAKSVLVDDDVVTNDIGNQEDSNNLAHNDEKSIVVSYVGDVVVTKDTGNNEIGRVSI